MDASWTHKGTSEEAGIDTPLKGGQDALPDAHNYTTGDGELMWYYSLWGPWSLRKAGKEDVRGAIWLAQLKFN